MKPAIGPASPMSNRARREGTGDFILMNAPNVPAKFKFQQGMVKYFFKKAIEGVLPDSIIWDLVAYVRNIGRQPKETWGQTISAQHPKIEQVPAEYFQSANPWSQTEAFSRGQKPNRTR